MIQKIVRLLLSLSSFSVVILFYVIATGGNDQILRVHTENKLWVYLGFFVTLVLIAYTACLLAHKRLPRNDTLTINNIQPAESKFLPAYIGLFVVAFELANIQRPELLILLGILFVLWLFLENTAYFNPLLFIFGYRFYEVESRAGVIYTVISKKKDIKKKDDSFTGLIRIGNFVFMETKE